MVAAPNSRLDFLNSVIVTWYLVTIVRFFTIKKKKATVSNRISAHSSL